MVVLTSPQNSQSCDSAQHWTAITSVFFKKKTCWTFSKYWTSAVEYFDKRSSNALKRIDHSRNLTQENNIHQPKWLPSAGNNLRIITTPSSISCPAKERGFFAQITDNNRHKVNTTGSLPCSVAECWQVSMEICQQQFSCHQSAWPNGAERSCQRTHMWWRTRTLRALQPFQNTTRDCKQSQREGETVNKMTRNKVHMKMTRKMQCNWLLTVVKDMTVVRWWHLQWRLPRRAESLSLSI